MAVIIKDLKQFCVVKFVLDESLEVIPTGWIDTRKSNLCYFPDDTRNKILALRSNPKSKPNKDSWPSYEISVKYTSDDFLQARQASIKLQYSSTVETGTDNDAADHIVKLRKNRKRRIIYSPPIKTPKSRQRETRVAVSSESESEAIGVDEYACTALVPLFSAQDVETCVGVADPGNSNDLLCGNISRNSAKFSLESTTTDNSSDASKDCEKSPLLPEARANVDKDLTFTPLSTGATSQTEIEVSDGLPLTHQSKGADHLPCCIRKKPLKFADDFTQTFIAEFRRFEKTILSEIHDIKADVEILRANISKQTSRREVCPIEIPIENDLSLQVAEEILKSKLARQKLVQWCCGIGGADYKVQTRRILTRIFSHELALGISYTGKGDKICFKNLNICSSVVAGVCGVEEFDCSESQVESVCQKWFRYSKDRNGGRAKRSVLVKYK